MGKSYLTSAFEDTVSGRFPEKARALGEAMQRRLEKLRAENAGASREKRRHLESQILPGIAVYETLQSVYVSERFPVCTVAAAVVHVGETAFGGIVFV